MFSKSKIKILNKKEPTAKIQIWSTEKSKWRTVEQENCILAVGEEVMVLSKCRYSYKEGFFYIVLTKRNATLNLDSSELDFFEGEFVNDEKWLLTKTPELVFHQPIPVSSFDNFNIF